MLPLIMFCLAYLANFGLYPRLIYPRSNKGINKSKKFNLIFFMNMIIFLGEFERSIHRALLYNSLPKNTTLKPNIAISDNLSNVATMEPNSYKLVCYYSYPRSSDSLLPDEIDPYLCTHINAAFAGVVNNTVSMDSNDLDVVKELVKLKMVNPKLKILICVGGASNDGGFSEMVMNHTNRKM